MAHGIYDPASLPVRALCSVLQVLGIVITIWRIGFRIRIRRFWWEDAWAGVTLLVCLVSLIGEWMYLFTHGLSCTVGFWFYALGSASATRAAQLSIAFSIIRILPETRLRRFTFLLAACCGAFWAVTIIGKIWQCASDPSWHQYDPPSCHVGPVALFEFASDCATVIILVALPLRVLWRTKLPRRQRRMILCVFASSTVLAFAAIFHIVGYILNIDLVMVAGVDFETACAVIVCNLLVVVTCAYRHLRRGNDSLDYTTTSDTDTDTDDFTQPRRQTTRLPTALTTVEIGSLMTQRDTPEYSARSCPVSN